MNKPLVLIVDDNNLNLKYLRDSVASFGYDCVTALGAKDAFSILNRIVPDLILLDIVMPEMDGFEVCRTIKRDDRLAGVPIIFLTALSNTEDVVNGFLIGGVDYIVKPFQIEELRQRVRTHVELKLYRDEILEKNKELEIAYANIAEINQELKTTMKKLEIASITDPLTSLYNRRYIMERLEQENARVKRYGGVYSLVISDIDRFKGINDTYGHICGDIVLQSVSKEMAKGLRVNDIVGRWGGEEFIMILPETPLESAHFVAERIRMAVSESTFDFARNSFNVTMTFGICESKGARPSSDVIHLADEALYEGKNSGRNKIVTRVE